MKRILSLLMVVTMILSVFSFQVVSAQEHSDENYSRVVTIEDGTEVYLEAFGTAAPAGTYPFLIVETVTFTTPINCTVSGSTTKKWAGHMIITYDSMYENFDGANFVQQVIDEELMYVGIALEEENGFAFDGALAGVDYYRRQFTQATGKLAFPGSLLTKKGTIEDISEMTNYSLILLDSDTFSFDSKNTFRTADFSNSMPDPSTYQDYNNVFTIYVKNGEEVSKDEYEGGGAVTEYTVTFKNGDSVLQSATVVEGAAVTAPEEPTAPVDADPAYNYTFVGWSDGEDVFASDKIPVATDNVEYTAVFNSVKKTVTATFVVEGKDNVTETVEYGETPTAAGVDTTVEGKTFTGWSPALGSITEDTTYTAQFAIKTYDITFVVNGQSTTKKVNHNEKPDFGSTPAKDGYNFIGWSLTDNGAIIEIPAATGAATYYAVFEEKAPVQYTITFVVDGQDDVVLTVNEGTKPAFTGTPSKDGHTFEGWEAEDGTVYTGELPVATANAIYTAKFEKNPDAVTMDVPLHINGTNGNILPGGFASVEVEEFTVLASELLRVHTTFGYNSEYGELAEMGMLFVPKKVAGTMSQDEIIDADITKDACCKDIANLTGNTNVTFKAGLIGIPAKNIEIYAIPYYKLSTGGRIYQTMQTISF